MSKFRVRLHYGGFYRLRSDPDVVRELERRGKRVVDAANKTMPGGEGYAMSSFQGQKKPQGRWFVQVYTRSNHAKRSNAKNNTLLSAMDEAK